MGRISLYSSKKWARVRRQVLDRDGWKCRAVLSDGTECGKRGRLEVDHLLALIKGGKPYDLDNLGAKCYSCHRTKTDIEMGRTPSPERQAWERYLQGMIE